MKVKVVFRIIVDTRHFKGNFPESVKIDGCCVDEKLISDEEVCASAGDNDDDTAKDGIYNNNNNNKLGGKEKETQQVEWFTLLQRTSLAADAEHEFL